MTRVLLDTSVLIGVASPADVEGAISAATLAELHFGALLDTDSEERARRTQRLAVIEAAFDPIPVDAPVAREWGRLSAAVSERGGQPRRRAVDLVIAATANVHNVPLLTADASDLAIIDDLVDVVVFDAASD